MSPLRGSHVTFWRWLLIASICMSTITLALCVYFAFVLAEQDRQFCQVRKAQRVALVQQKKNTDAYLASPAGREKNGLNDFIVRISVPQLNQRLQTETVPPSCRD